MVYNTYHWSKKTYLLYSIAASTVVFIVSLIFFKPIFLALALSSAGFAYPLFKKKEIIQKQKAVLNLQFKQALYVLSAALGAGRSVESAFQESLRDLVMIYPDANAYIIREFKLIHRRIENGESIENALSDFSSRAGTEDIQSFVDVFILCKRSGGNLVEVMRNTANIISEKLQIQQEIAVMLSRKKLEGNILSAAPIIFVLVLRISSPDYMEPMYYGVGVWIMLLALVLLVCCLLLSRWIMSIKV